MNPSYHRVAFNVAFAGALLAVSVLLPMSADAANNWAVGNLVGLCQGTQIRAGSGLSFPVTTIVPQNNW